MSNRRASHDLAETFALALALCWDCERSWTFGEPL